MTDLEAGVVPPVEKKQWLYVCCCFVAGVVLIAGVVLVGRYA